MTTKKQKAIKEVFESLNKMSREELLELMQQFKYPTDEEIAQYAELESFILEQNPPISKFGKFLYFIGIHNWFLPYAYDDYGNYTLDKYPSRGEYRQCKRCNKSQSYNKTFRFWA